MGCLLLPVRRRLHHHRSAAHLAHLLTKLLHLRAKPLHLRQQVPRLRGQPVHLVRQRLTVRLSASPHLFEGGKSTVSPVSVARHRGAEKDHQPDPGDGHPETPVREDPHEITPPE